jgi:MoxR-like ATPase
MARAPWAPDRLYDVAARWVATCLRDQGSLFGSDKPLWTKSIVDEAVERMLAVDTTQGEFITTLHDELEGRSDDAITFMAELLYMHVLPIGNMGVPAKQSLIDETLSWAREPLAVPEDLVGALEGGVANFGAALTRRDKQVKCFARFVQGWVALDDAERGRLLGDPWAFRDYVHELELPPLMQREAILHLVFPETFEYALAASDKTKIRSALNAQPRVAEAENDDQALVVVRELVEDALGYPLNLYLAWFQAFWRAPAAGRWPEALDWARRFYESEEFADDEYNYKLDVGERMSAAREALERDDQAWQEKLRFAFENPPNNFVHPRFERPRLLDWCDERPDEAATFLRRLWSGDPFRGGVSEAIDLLKADVLPGESARISVCAALLAGLDERSFPPYRRTVVDRFQALVGGSDGPPAVTQLPSESSEDDGWAYDEQTELGAEPLAVGTDDADTYAMFLTMLDDVRVRLLARNVQLRDRLDAQSIVWLLAQGKTYNSWSDDEKAAFAAFVESGLTQEPTKPTPVEASADLPAKAWLVRGANVDGVNLVPKWIEEGYVSIGWHELGGDPLPSTDTEIYERVRVVYTDDSPGAWRAATGNLNRFWNRMRQGDLVLTVDGDKLYVGRVASDPFYESDSLPGAVRRRKVDWLNGSEPASRAEVQVSYPSLYSRMRTLLTVTDLKGDAAAVAALVGLGQEPEPEPPATLAPADEALANQVYLPVPWLQEVIDLLAEKRQLIFYGPPGTGKTFLAQRLAEHLTHNGGGLEIVQFHPSYGYEDFFEGYRPAQTTDGVGVTYELTPGPLRRIAEAAAADPQHPYVLVIDEINRGNLPKIFGELLFLLEYREAQIPLQYSPESLFGLPKNLFVIGTMNTADRSIALVDAALRRRFYFVPFMPTEPPVSNVLSKWLTERALEDRPARLLTALNERIANEEIAIGPSYFMTAGTEGPDVARIWKHAILPVLEEHFYGVNRDVEAEFGLDTLEKALHAEIELAEDGSEEAGEEA